MISIVFFVLGLYAMYSTVKLLKQYKKKYGEDLERFIDGSK